MMSDPTQRCEQEQGRGREALVSRIPRAAFAWHNSIPSYQSYQSYRTPDSLVWLPDLALRLSLLEPVRDAATCAPEGRISCGLLDPLLLLETLQPATATLLQDAIVWGDGSTTDDEGTEKGARGRNALRQRIPTPCIGRVSCWLRASTEGDAAHRMWEAVRCLSTLDELTASQRLS